jgi:DNA-binding NarL/FixJ family response regulator
MHPVRYSVQSRCNMLKTVGNYVSMIFTKLQVADRAQAIIRAREAGLG